MNLFDLIIINNILVLSPLMVNLFYSANQKNICRKINNLFLDLAIISSVYLLYKFHVNSNESYTLIMINILLFISFINSRYIVSTGIAVFLVLVFYVTLNYNIVFLIVFYLLLFFMFYFNKTKYKKTLFISLISLFLLFVLKFDFSLILKHLFLFVPSLFLTEFFLKISEQIIQYHLTIKNLEQEKQIRTSLFRISHEIKNPIAVCKGYLDMFDLNDKDRSVKYIPIIKDEIDRVLILLEDFLSFTKVKICKDIMDINLLLESAYKNFIPIFKEKNIKVKLDITEDELFILGDYARLTQVIINIIKNSIESITKKGVINIKLIEEKELIIIIIEDNGIGMSKEELEKLKEPFFTTKKNGTGLGVSFSNEIIKSHKGSLEYISNKNQGTQVKLTLPKKIDKKNY